MALSAPGVSSPTTKIELSDMDPGLFRRTARKLAQAGIEDIGLSLMDEVFTAPKFLVECLGYLKRELSVPYVAVMSDGTLATPENVERAMEAGLDALSWTVNAADAEQYERIAGRPRLHFYASLDNIREAHLVRSMGGFKTALIASSLLYDKEQWQKMQPLLAERILPYVDEHHWFPSLDTDDSWGV